MLKVAGGRGKGGSREPVEATAVAWERGRGRWRDPKQVGLMAGEGERSYGGLRDLGLSLWVGGTSGRGCKWMRSWWAELGAQIGTCLLEAPMQLSCGRADVLVGAEEKLFQTCGEMCV